MSPEEEEALADLRAWRLLGSKLLTAIEPEPPRRMSKAAREMRLALRLEIREVFAVLRSENLSQSWRVELGKVTRRAGLPVPVDWWRQKTKNEADYLNYLRSLRAERKETLYWQR
jgi:hypothetical protein